MQKFSIQGVQRYKALSSIKFVLREPTPQNQTVKNDAWLENLQTTVITAIFYKAYKKAHVEQLNRLITLKAETIVLRHFPHKQFVVKAINITLTKTTYVMTAVRFSGVIYQA